MEPTAILTASVAVTKLAFFTCTEIQNTIKTLRDVPEVVRSLHSYLRLTEKANEKLSEYIGKNPGSLSEENSNALTISLTGCQSLLNRIRRHVDYSTGPRTIFPRRMSHVYNEAQLKEDLVHLKTQYQAQQHLFRAVGVVPPSRSESSHTFLRLDPVSESGISSLSSRNILSDMDDGVVSSISSHGMVSDVGNGVVSNLSPPDIESGTGNSVGSSNSTLNIGSEMGASTVVGSRSSVIYQNTIHTASTSTLRSILSLPNRTLRKFSFSARDTRKLSQQLIATAFRGDDDRVYELLEAGADVNYKENQRRVAICSAASRGHTSTVRVLLENHARVDSVDGQGMTPLMWAVTTETEDLVELLCSYHAKLNKKDKKGSTALHKAASGRPRMTELLLSKNVDYNVPDQDSMRPINFACEKGDDSSLRLLVQAGADVSAKYSPPIRNCIWNLHVGTVKTLIDIGVSLSVRYHIRETDKGKVSALSHAACIALDESVKNYWAKDTLHDWTRYDKAIEIIGILRNAGAIARGSLTHVYGSDGEQSASFYYGGMLPDLIAFKWNQKLACIGHPYYYGATPEMRANILNEQRRLERLEQQTALSIRQPASQPSTVEYPNATLQPSPSLFPTSHYSLNDQSALFTGHFPGSSNNLQSPLNYLLWIGKAEQPQPAHDNQRISEPARGSARSIYSERGAGALDIEC